MSDLVLTLPAPQGVAHGPCGAFGKIVALGDFVRFDLPRDFVAAWDVWLQDMLPAAQRLLGPRWTDSYMSAPIWRFTLAAGVAGEAPAMGVLMPSTDRVGRVYPLTLAMPLREDSVLAEAHFMGGRLFEAIEEIALATLDAVPLTALRERCAGVAGADHNPWDPAPGLAAQSLPQYRGQALWSARVEAGFRLIRTDGLPGVAAFAALLDPEAPIWQGAAQRIETPT